MREERGQLPGGQLIAEPMTLWGSIGGDTTVTEGGKVYVRGAIYGNLEVEFGGRVHIFGSITGNLTVHRGAKVIHSGVLGGDAINLGGRLYIEQTATISGKIKTKKGETKVSPLFQGGYVPPPEPEAPAKPIPRRYRDEADERKRYDL
jgi:cytoskeletal protein CcmA (bactofilin family)